MKRHESREAENPARAGLSSNSSGWIRTTDLTIMSRARRCEPGAVRRRGHTKVLEFAGVATATLVRDYPGLCPGVDAW
jgi:hypothetical protein